MKKEKTLELPKLKNVKKEDGAKEKLKTIKNETEKNSKPNELKTNSEEKIKAKEKTDNKNKIPKEKKEKIDNKNKILKEKLFNKTTIIIASIVFVCVLTGVFTLKYLNYQKNKEHNEMVLQNATTALNLLYQNKEKEIPKYEITTKDVNNVSKKIEKVVYNKEKKDLTQKLDKIDDFVKVKETLESYFDGDILKSSTTLKQIEKLNNKYQKLSENVRNLLKEKLEKMKPQYESIVALDEKVKTLFSDDERTKVKDSVTREEYKEVLALADAILQEDVKLKQKEYLSLVDKTLTQKEEAERRRIEEEKRKERERQIAAAWVKLDVPYISQNLSGVLNGCEVATLLMALKYKGYLGGMSIGTYAEMLPKSTDPNQGFTYSIYDLEPRDVAHWIAPAPLAAFGRSTSGANVADVSGSALATLDNEVLAGNPVIIYLTGDLKAPQAWAEGVPKNLHVYVLAGYNTMTKEQYLIDPWARATHTWTTSFNKVQSLYGAIGNKALVVR